MRYQHEGGVLYKGALQVLTNDNSITPYCVCEYTGACWQQVAPWRVYFGVAVRDMRKLLRSEK